MKIRRFVKIAAAGTLLALSAGAGTPGYAQDESNCFTDAKAYCQSIGANSQCVHYWTMRCEQGYPIPGRAPAAAILARVE